jgi:hypothetical protein
MTIVVGVGAPDGLILAADSRTTYLWDGGRHRVASDSAQKLFPICEKIGVATYDDAFIGQRTIAGLMDEFVAQRGAELPSDVDELARALGAFFHERFEADSSEELLTWCRDNPNQSRIGFLIACYDPEGIGVMREVTIPGPTIVNVDVDTVTRGACWRGQTDVIRRLIKGFDLDQFLAAGHELSEGQSEPIAHLEYSLLLPVTVQDAIDLACFLIRTTIEMQRFSDGTIGNPSSVPGCGGEIRVLSVTRTGADWITPPALQVGTEPTAIGG